MPNLLKRNARAKRCLLHQNFVICGDVSDNGLRHCDSSFGRASVEVMDPVEYIPTRLAFSGACSKLAPGIKDSERLKRTPADVLALEHCAPFA